MPVTELLSVVPVRARSSASSALAKLIVPAAPAGVARTVIWLRIVVSEFAADASVLEWQLEHCGESVVLNACSPAFESPVVCACAAPATTASSQTHVDRGPNFTPACSNLMSSRNPPHRGIRCPATRERLARNEGNLVRAREDFRSAVRASAGHAAAANCARRSSERTS